MLNQRWRPVVFSLLAVLVVWMAALGGHYVARNSQMTAEKVKTYMEETDLSKLSGTKRAEAIGKLAEKLNSLSYEERRKARLEPAAFRWMEQMTEAEKTQFIESTLPAGFKQMLAAFEQLPDEKRRKTIDDALKRLREAQNRLQTEYAGPEGGSAPPPVISAELQAKIRTLGLKAYYSESSAQTKAELAPVIEELQRVMESGRPFRSR